jgi:hypothetical protein
MRRDWVRIQWSRISDERLLQMRICDLPIRIQGSPLQRRIRNLYRELKVRGLRFRPHVWLSNEFFTPDGVPGFAIPFYLAHPRLIQLERRQILEAEGGTETECMCILRHETGHALDHAYRLHRKREWRKVFGPVSTPYPTSYKPNPLSRNHVLHLNYWYAQAHPLEDFAETFAVWLRPGARWRARYKDWPAFRKLKYVNTLMMDIGEKPRLEHARYHVDPISDMTMTLAQHYRRKKNQYTFEFPEFYDSDLLSIFSTSAPSSRPTAVRFFKWHRAELRSRVSAATGVHAYTVDHILQNMQTRAKQLRLRMSASRQETRLQAMIALTMHTMNLVYSGKYRFRYGL